jgi:hypothetical protein
MEVQIVSMETASYLRSKAPEYWEIWRKKAGSYSNELLDKALELIKHYKKK